MVGEQTREGKRGFFDKAARFEVDSSASILSDRMYNMVIGGVTLYGLAANAFICLFFQEQVAQINPLALLIGYIILAFGGIAVVNFSRNPAVSFIGYNMIVIPMGAVISTMLIRYEIQDISLAILTTAAVVFIMLLVAALFPGLFLGLGKILFVSLLAVIVAELIVWFVTGTQPVIFDVAIAGIFSLYIGFDWQRANQYPKTLDNAVDSAADIYLDIINLFLSILRIVGRK